MDNSCASIYVELSGYCIGIKPYETDVFVALNRFLWYGMHWIGISAPKRAVKNLYKATNPSNSYGSITMQWTLNFSMIFGTRDQFRLKYL